MSLMWKCDCGSVLYLKAGKPAWCPQCGHCVEAVELLKKRVWLDACQIINAMAVTLIMCSLATAFIGGVMLGWLNYGLR